MYKRKLLTVAILVLVITLFGGGCAKNTIDSSNSDTQSKFTVNIMNSSDALITEIQYQSQNEGGGMLNADGSLMRKNDTFQLNFDNPKKVRDNVIEVALDYLSVGIDPEKTNILIQSEVSELTELTFYYMNLVTLSRLKRNPTVKNELKLRGFEDSVPVGFLNYPIK